MAREYSKVKLSIWNDPDFRTRTADGQGLYFTMLTNPGITSCGVVEWRESKLIKYSADMTVSRLREAAWNLGEVGLIAVDPDTEEALVRSFVRHDGVLQSPNMTLAMVREHGTIASLKLMALVSKEVRRAFDEHPDWKGFTPSEPVRKQFPEADGNPFEMVPEWFHLGSLGDGGSEGGTLPESFENTSPIPQPSSPTSIEVGKESAPRKRSTGTRLDPAFIPNESSRAKILAECPNVDLRREHAKFVDYWTDQPGSKGVRVSWNGTWCNWMRKAAEQAPSGISRRQQETDAWFERSLARAQAADAAEQAARGEISA